MRKKLTVGLIIVFVLVFMIVDFNVNGVRVFEDYARQMETESMQKLHQGRSFSISNGIPEGEPASRNLASTIETRGLNGLLVNNGVGSVKINGEERADIQVDYKITVYTDSVERSQKLIKGLDIKQEQVENKLALSLDQTGLADDVKAVKVDYLIRVPRSLELNIINSYGPLIVKDIDNNVKLTNRYEQLRAERLGGLVDINVRYGYLYLDEVAGETNVQVGFDNAEISNLKKGLTLKSDYGRVQLVNVAGPVEADCRYGIVQFDGIEGKLKLTSRYTQVSGKGPGGEMVADLKYGGLNLNDLQADLNVDSRYTDLNINLAPGINDLDLDLLSDHGHIITNLPFVVEEDDFQNKLQGKLGSGTIRLLLRTDYGDIKLQN